MSSKAVKAASKGKKAAAAAAAAAPEMMIDADAAAPTTAAAALAEEESVLAAPEDAEHLQFDLGRLSVFSEKDVEFAALRRPGFVDALATEHTQLLFAKIFALPSEVPENGDSGRIVQLPLPRFPLPREKPVPKAKKLTRWEEFALKKGIQKRKREHQVLDEATGEYKRSWGYKRANAEEEVPIIVHNEKRFGKEDPWTVMRREKAERVEQNKKNQEANVRAAATGSRKAVPGSLDLTSVLGEKRPPKNNAKGKDGKGGLSVTHQDIALRIAQRSTNSMGKFDRMRKNEPALLAPKAKRRDAELQNPAVERAQSAAVMKKVLGRVKEAEALSSDRAVASIGGSDVRKGEIVTARNVEKKRALKGKMSTAKGDRRVKEERRKRLGTNKTKSKRK